MWHGPHHLLHCVMYQKGWTANKSVDLMQMQTVSMDTALLQEGAQDIVIGLTQQKHLPAPRK